MLAAMRPAALLALALALAAAAPAPASRRRADRPPARLARERPPRAAVPASPRGSRRARACPQIGLVTVRPAGRASRSRALRAAPARATRASARSRSSGAARPRFVPDDPALDRPRDRAGHAAGHVVQWWAARMGLFEAWDLARGGDALVAVVDSGVDGAHPELAGKVRATLDADPTAGRGGPLVDEAGHGTHVASLACAASGNGVGMAGAGLDCGLVVAKTDFSDGVGRAGDRRRRPTAAPRRST